MKMSSMFIHVHACTLRMPAQTEQTMYTVSKTIIAPVPSASHLVGLHITCALLDSVHGWVLGGALSVPAVLFISVSIQCGLGPGVGAHLSAISTPA